MTSPVSISLLLISSILALGTIYSVYHSTYLDTSDPLLTHLPHRLQTTHYFANKSNLLNVIFIKNAWGWTSAAFAFIFFTGPSQTRTKERLVKYTIVTALWLWFTSWFFGPALLERVIVATGGECMVHIPKSSDVLSVPVEYCYTKSTLSPATHPSLFSTLLGDPSVVSASSWTVRPRLRRGHDISGHVFLLTMSVMFLADQLKMCLVASDVVWSFIHKCAIMANLAMITVWMFAIYTTAVYFHSPGEKLSGYLLGLVGFAMTQFSFLNPRMAVDDKVKVHEH